MRSKLRSLLRSVARLSVLAIFLAASGTASAESLLERLFSGAGASSRVIEASEAERAGFGWRLAEAAFQRTKARVLYDGAYQRIAYPMGDVAPNRGVCSDVIVRSYRALGHDLQQLVHEDMRRAFHRYPQAWGLSRPDPNIDHRRVLNLERYFERRGARLPVSDDPADYRPGDLVTYRVGRNLPHIGIVSTRLSADGKRPMVVHNIGAGPRLEDFLFAYPIVAHYRFAPEE